MLFLRQLHNCWFLCILYESFSVTFQFRYAHFMLLSGILAKSLHIIQGRVESFYKRVYQDLNKKERQLLEIFYKLRLILLKLKHYKEFGKQF